MDDKLMYLTAIALGVILAKVPCDAPGIPDRYDRLIESAVHRYWPINVQPFWCWWKAQLWAESRLDPTATSYTGAEGIAQVMPATGMEQKNLLGLDCDSYDPRCSITVGTAYSSRMMQIFTSPRTTFDLLCHGAVAYNAGVGNNLRSQRLAKSEDCDAVLKTLPQVTGKHAAETQGYISRIRSTFLHLISGGNYGELK